MIHIMNYYTRDPQYLVDEVRRQGYEPIVKTDHTNFSKKRDINRYRGLNQNYLSILKSPHYTNDWKIILHDDIELKAGVLDKMNHVMQYAPQNILSFFTAPNNDYDRAMEKGHRVLRTYTNIWYPASAVHRSFCEGFTEWVEKRIPPENLGTVAEDALIPAYLSEIERPAYAILPALVQHAGFDRSTHKNPAKVAGRYRISYHYDPDQNVTEVDWKSEFDNPHSVMSRYKIVKFKLLEG